MMEKTGCLLVAESHSTIMDSVPVMWHEAAPRRQGRLNSLFRKCSRMRKQISWTITFAAITTMATTFCSSADAQWGTLKGRIILDGEMPKQNPLVKKGDPTAKDAAVCAAQDVPSEKLVVDPSEHGIANIFIYMQKKPEKIHPDLLKSKDGELKFDQKGCRFIPHAMVVRTDQKVRVLSQDAVAHNTHSNPIKNTPENFVVPPSDQTGILMKPLALAERVPVRINCDIHPWMEAYWVVLDHPYAAVTDEKGNYEIPNLSVGEHEFTIWHEGCGFLEKKYPVTIKAGTNEQKTLKYSAAKILK